MSSRKSATGSVPKITPGRMQSVLDECFSGSIPAMFWGPPGVGKSDCVRAYTKKHKLGCIDIRLSQYDPVDLRGVPRVEVLTQRVEALKLALSIAKELNMEKECLDLSQQIQINMESLLERGNTVVTQWASPSFLPMPERDGEKGILFLDEITSADGQVQAAAYQLVLDRRLGDYELPDGWLVVAAGNRPEDRAVVKDMSSALANRFCHFEVEHDLQDWIDWAFSAKVDPRVISYQRYKSGGSLYKFDPTSNDKAFPTPRTWERVSDVLKACHGAIPSDTVQGCVGIGEGVEFEAFSDLESHLPDANLVLSQAMNGEKVDLPSIGQNIRKTKKKRVRDESGALITKEVKYEFDGSCLLYMLLTSLAARASEETAPAMWSIIDQLASEGHHRDYSVWFLSDCVRVSRDAITGYEKGQRLIAWSRNNKDLVASLRHVQSS